MANVVDYSPARICSAFIQDYIPNELFYNFIVGPVGCLDGQTEVLTEYGPIRISDIDRPMRVLSWNEKTCRFQLSWCGGSFPKGKDYLYRVSTPQGEFDAAGAHLLLCEDGEYRRVEELHQGDVLASHSYDRQQTISGLCQPEFLSSEHHCLRTLVDSLERYAVSARQYGQRFLQEEDTCQESSPSQDDAQKSTWWNDLFEDVRKGVQSEQSLEHSHCDQYDDRSCIGGSKNQASRLRLNEACHDVPSTCEHNENSILPIPLSQWMTGLHRHAQKLFSLIHSFRLTPPKRVILSIKRLDVKEAYWDLQVAETHNYVTVDGAIHHNSGKSTANIMKIAYMAGLQEPGPDGIRRTKVVWVRNTGAQLLDTSIPSFFTWFKDGIAGIWKATPKTFILKYADVECEVMFRALDNPDDVSRVLSLEVTFVVLDEFVQIPKEIVEALSGRCGRYPSKKDGGATNFGMWGASNPGEEDTWWYTHLVESIPSNVTYFHQPSGFSPDAENLENLPNKYYENQAKGKSFAWVKQFIEAEWGYSVAGRPVVPTFSRELHVSKTRLHADPYLPLIIGFDPGMHSALIFGQVDFFGRACIVDELILEGYGAERMIKDRLLPLLKAKYAGFEIIIAPDPASNSRTPTNETTVLQILKDQKYKQFWTVSVDNTNLLSPRLEAIDHFTTRLTEKGPALQIDPDCKKIIRALASGWRFEKTQKNDEKSAPEKNESSHPGDAFGYFCRYHVRNEARYGRKQQSSRRPLPTFSNPYVTR